VGATTGPGPDGERRHGTAGATSMATIEGGEAEAHTKGGGAGGVTEHSRRRGRKVDGYISNTSAAGMVI
jgi:hypothetical protein